MTSKNDVYVEMGNYKVSKTSIYTDCLASCHCLLIDGIYEDVPFAFMNHNSFGVASGTTSENLKLLLDSLVTKLKETLVTVSKSTIQMTSLNDLRLLVCGAAIGLKDHEREAYSLLINPSQYTRDRLVSILDDECTYLFHQLVNRTVIIKSVICKTPDEDEDDGKLHGKKIIVLYGLSVHYDCHIKKGLIVIEWGSEATDAHGILAHMKFKMLSEKENEYQWNILQNQITNIKNKIGTQNEELKHLNNALSLIPSRSFFVSSSSKNSIYSSESHDNIDEYEIIKFKLMRSESDFDIEFSPKFTHGIFDQKEKLLVYKNLQINIFCLLSSLDFYLNINYDEKINPEYDPQFELHEITASLNQWLPSSTTTNPDLFVTKLQNENEYPPFGEQILTYELKGEESSPYFIYRINQQNLCNNSKFFDWYARLKTFLVFFIDIVSSVTQNDSDWISYIIYKQYQNVNGNTCYAPIGFTTIYLCYAFPDKKRPRISEMLIFPPYQRQGHGRRLLTMIYDDLKTNSNVQDIIVVNPSNEFIALHDLVSFGLCYKYLYDLFSKESINKKNRITQEIIDKARNVCKLTKKQTRRVYEMYFLRSIDQNNNEQMKRFRLIVKQRIFHEIQYNQHPDLQLRSSEVRKIYLTTQYENVLQHYKHILETFDKHYCD